MVRDHGSIKDSARSIKKEEPSKDNRLGLYRLYEL
jgi:hypothetical protein